MGVVEEKSVIFDAMLRALNKEREKLREIVDIRELQSMTLQSASLVLVLALHNTIETIESRFDVLDNIVPEIKSTLLALAEPK